MATFLIILQLLVVLTMIFIGAKVGSIGLGIYGMVGVFILVFCFGLEPGVIPVDVMLIIVSVITASAALQAAGGLDYMVQIAAKILRRHPSRITFYAPFVTWLFCFLAGTAHTCYALLPIISEIAYKEKVRPERPLAVSTIAASLGITGSPVSAATAAILSSTMLGGAGIGIKEIMIITVPASLIAIFVAALVQNFVGKPLEQDPEYQRRVREGLIDPETEAVQEEKAEHNPRAMWAVLAFLLGVILVVLFGAIPAIRPQFRGEPMNMNYIIEIIMMSIAALILFVGKADVRVAVKGNVFVSGMNAMVSIFGVGHHGIRSRYLHLMADPVRDTAVPVQHHALLAGCYGEDPLSGRFGARRAAAYPAGALPGCQRLFLPAELPDGGSRYWLRPNRHHPHR